MHLIVILFAAIGILIGNEWLFFISKPSLLSSLPMINTITLGLRTQVALFLLILPTFASLYLICSFISEKLAKVLWLIGCSFILSIAFLLLFENITYTFFKFNLSSANRLVTMLYIIMLLSIAHLLYEKLHDINNSYYRYSLYPIVIIVLLSIIVISDLLVVILTTPKNTNTYKQTKLKNKPNLIIIGSDGINANLMSAYGAKEKTTPFIDKKLPTALFCENALSNAGKTTGSIVSMLTGKSPLTTKVLFPPQTLQELDAFEHLPAILRKHDYYLMQESLRFYADSIDVNMRQSFHYANNRTITSLNSKIPQHITKKYLNESLFFYRIWDRIQTRFMQLITLKKSHNVYQLVKEIDTKTIYDFRDKSRLKRIFRQINYAKKNKMPFFAHIHFMDSHCCNIKPEITYYSAKINKKTPKKLKLRLKLKDATLSFDHLFKKLWLFLQKKNMLHNTIIVMYSDHTVGWNVNHKIPLIFWFPNGEYASSRKNNVQLLDVAPTILDYLKIPIPRWMQGVSVLTTEAPKTRPIYQIGKITTTPLKKVSYLKDFSPPLYGLDFFNMSICHRQFLIHSSKNGILQRHIANHSQKCKKEILPKKAHALTLMHKQLTNHGFLLPNRRRVNKMIAKLHKKSKQNGLN